MADRNGKHAFEQLTEDMKTGDIPAVVILRGSEGYLIDFYAKRLIGRYVSEQSEMLDLAAIERDKATLQAISEHLETMPFLSERNFLTAKAGCRRPSNAVRKKRRNWRN